MTPEKKYEMMEHIFANMTRSNDEQQELISSFSSKKLTEVESHLLEKINAAGYSIVPAPNEETIMLIIHHAPMNISPLSFDSDCLWSALCSVALGIISWEFFGGTKNLSSIATYVMNRQELENHTSRFARLLRKLKERYPHIEISLYSLTKNQYRYSQINHQEELLHSNVNASALAIINEYMKHSEGADKQELPLAQFTPAVIHYSWELVQFLSYPVPLLFHLSCSPEQLPFIEALFGLLPLTIIRHLTIIDENLVGNTSPSSPSIHLAIYCYLAEQIPETIIRINSLLQQSKIYAKYTYLISQDLFPKAAFAKIVSHNRLHFSTRAQWHSLLQCVPIFIKRSKSRTYPLPQQILIREALQDAVKQCAFQSKDDLIPELKKYVHGVSADLLNAKTLTKDNLMAKFIEYFQERTANS